MLGWLKSRRKGYGGPDFSRFDSRRKVEAAHGRGDLMKLLLMPLAFGGEDVDLNTVFVPVAAVALKERIDKEIVEPLAATGKVRRYAASPHYLGTSFVPAAIRIEASDPTSFNAVVHVWGDSAAVVGAGSEGADYTPAGLVRAFIEDYHAWNARAASTSDGPRDAQLEAAIERQYDAILRQYCPEGYVRQPLAYGGDSTFDPARSRIVGESVDAGHAVVVVAKPMHARSNAVHIHEFEFAERDGRWLLTGISQVDGAQRRPTL